MWYKAKKVIIPLAIPGPLSPGNIESFIYPLFQEMAMASEGIWTWDAVDSSYFVLRAYLCGVKGDMLGSAKLNGMAGHAALFGDHFSMVQGAQTSKEKGAKPQYYPLSPPQKKKFNPLCPDIDLNYIPMREQSHYWMTINQLLSAKTKKNTKQLYVRQEYHALLYALPALHFLIHHSTHWIHSIYFMRIACYISGTYG
jgi:hypothetical protein